MKQKGIFLIALTVIVAGCTDIDLQPDEPTDDWDTPDPEKGVEITSLEASDTNLRIEDREEGQRAEITLLVSNYHTEAINLEDFEIYNTGLLEVQNEEPDCTTERLERASSEEAPQAECTWTINAPSSDEVDDVDDRPEQVTVSFNYEASFTNQEAVYIEFEEQDEIDNVQDVRESFTNSEIEMIIDTYDTVRTGAPDDFELTVREGSAPGRVVSDYSFNYDPENLFDNCEETGEPEIESEYNFECNIENDNPVRQGLSVTADYKYEQTETLPITISE